MTFQEKYLALTGKFKAQVEKDNRDFKWEGKNRSEYLPNFEPNGPVDFVLVAMEPSTGVKAKAGTISSPRNFSWSVDDFIMHFCVQNYLCGDGQTYHVTDLAKGAMPTQQAKKTAKKRWPSWYKLLKKELELVTNPDAPVIAIGRQVKTFLENQKMAESPVRSIPHYSRQARVAKDSCPRTLARAAPQVLEISGH